MRPDVSGFPKRHTWSLLAPRGALPCVDLSANGKRTAIPTTWTHLLPCGSAGRARCCHEPYSAELSIDAARLLELLAEALDAAHRA